jgi:hypothetical protein
MKLCEPLLQVRLRVGRERQTTGGLRLRRFQALEHLFGVSCLSGSGLEVTLEGRNLPLEFVSIALWTWTSTPLVTGTGAYKHAA